MNNKMAEALIEKDCFESVMTAMRGPDKEDEAELKLPFTAVLRWAVGFDYGIVERPRDVTFSIYEMVTSHFEKHLNAAFTSLEMRFGWSISRVPLVAYVDPQAAKSEALEILDRIKDSLYLVNEGGGPAGKLIQSCFDKIMDADPETDPDLHLTLPNY